VPLRDRLRKTPARQPEADHELRFVFVVTYGRSGSTLLQGLLNDLPRTVVRGENGLWLLEMYRAYRLGTDFAKRHTKHASGKTSSAFYGLDHVKPRQFVRATRKLVVPQLLGDETAADVDVVGFKEVLWHRILPEETEGFFAWFEEVFPGARYVLNTRDHERVARSGFWQRQQDEVADALARVEEILAWLRETRPDRVLDTRYEVLTGEDRAAADEQLAALADFVVGDHDEALLARLRATLDVPHGPRPFENRPDGGDDTVV
jgi:hypothetical protein